MTKAQFQKAIKENGHTTFDGVTTATIAGYKVSMEKSIIVVDVDGIEYKFPSFTEVEESGLSLDFLTVRKNGGIKCNSYYSGDNKVADAYIAVAKAILNK